MDDKKQALAGIVGQENILDDPDALKAYSRDQSFTLPMTPSLAVKPETSDEVEEIVMWANKSETPLVPVSSGPPRFRGDTVPSSDGTVIVDLSSMNKIIMIDRKNRVAAIEPGVTYGQLQPELEKEGLSVPLPLAPRANKSVVTSIMEREPRLIPRNQWSFIEPLRCLELVLPDGQMMRTGDAGGLGDLLESRKKHHLPISAAGPYQMDTNKLVSAAQGSMGIATWGSIKCELLPKVHRLYYATANKPEGLIDFVYRILRFRFADELMILDRTSLAFLLADSQEEVDSLREKLPLWIALVGIGGHSIIPEEKVDYQSKDISDIAQQYGLELVSEIPGARNSDVLKVLKNPSKETYWKSSFKGAFQDIFFLTTLDKTPSFINKMSSLSEPYGYPNSDIGVYLQPVHQGTACHCEFIIPYHPDNGREVSKIREFYPVASQELLNMGAYYSRPYGIWADLAFNRDAHTTMTLKNIKNIFDPNHVMNPGKLCF